MVTIVSDVTRDFSGSRAGSVQEKLNFLWEDQDGGRLG